MHRVDSDGRELKTTKNCKNTHTDTSASILKLFIIDNQSSHRTATAEQCQSVIEASARKTVAALVDERNTNSSRN